jgi:hypothetical protein
MPVKNEQWCLEYSIKQALKWCNQLVIGLHDCTDYSTEMVLSAARARPGRIRYEYLEGPWIEMVQRQELLMIARDMRATHVALVDADEVVTENVVDQLPHVIRGLGPGEILRLPLFNLRGSLIRYHNNGLWGSDRVVSVAFTDQPAALWQGNDFHHREPWGVNWRFKLARWMPEGGVMHLWGADERRLAAKHALYAVTERLRFPQRPVVEIAHKYGQAFDNFANHWTFTDVPPGWWDTSGPYIDLDQVPWQEEVVRNAVLQHGAERFAGLNLHGLDRPELKIDTLKP